MSDELKAFRETFAQPNKEESKKILNKLHLEFNNKKYSKVVNTLDDYQDKYGIGDEDDPIPKYEYANDVSPKTANRKNVLGLLRYACIKGF